MSRDRDTVSLDVSPWIGDSSEPRSSPWSLFLFLLSLVQGPRILLVLLTPWSHILLQPPEAQGLEDEGPSPVLHGAPAAGCLVPKCSTVPALHLGRKEEGSVVWDRGHHLWLVRCQLLEDHGTLPPASVQEGHRGGIATIRLKRRSHMEMCGQMPAWT